MSRAPETQPPKRAAAVAPRLDGPVRPCNRSETITVEEFFAEAKRLNLRMLGTPEETRVALDLKDAEIDRLRAEVARLKEHAVTLANTERHVERERCALLCEELDNSQNTNEYRTAARWAAVRIRGA